MLSFMHPHLYTGNDCPYCGGQLDAPTKPEFETPNRGRCRLVLEMHCSKCLKNHKVYLQPVLMQLQLVKGCGICDVGVPFCVVNNPCDELAPPLPFVVSGDDDGIGISPFWYGDGANSPGGGTPIYVSMEENGHPEVTVWTDANDDGETTVVPLTDCHESLSSHPESDQWAFRAELYDNLGTIVNIVAFENEGTANEYTDIRQIPGWTWKVVPN